MDRLFACSTYRDLLGLIFSYISDAADFAALARVCKRCADVAGAQSDAPLRLTMPMFFSDTGVYMLYHALAADPTWLHGDFIFVFTVANVSIVTAGRYQYGLFHGPHITLWCGNACDVSYARYERGCRTQATMIVDNNMSMPLESNMTFICDMCGNQADETSILSMPRCMVCYRSKFDSRKRPKRLWMPRAGSSVILTC